VNTFLESHLVGAIYSLGSNFAVVISAMLVVIFLFEGKVDRSTFRWKMTIGVSFGVFAILSMLAPIKVRPGIIIDAKYVLTAISTYFGGPLAGLVTMAISGSSRALLGGIGVYAAIPTLLASWLAGLAFRRLSQSEGFLILRLRDFALLGVTLFVLQLLGGFAFLLFLPWSEVKVLLVDRSIPAMVIFPPMTVLLGLALDFIESRNQAVIERTSMFEQLERRNQELQVLNHSLHHDLRTPLVTVQGFLGEIQENLEHGDIGSCQKDLQRIIDATERLATLINGISKLNEASEFFVHGECANAVEVVRVIANRYTQEARAKNLSIEIRVEPCLIPMSNVSFGRLMNALLENAIRFSSGNSGTQIEIGGTVQQHGFQFWVQDHGIGVEPQYHEKIFGLFDKLNPKGPGTGLGLALAKRIVDSHQGRIWMESAGIGCGSRVQFFIPSSKKLSLSHG